VEGTYKRRPNFSSDALEVILQYVEKHAKVRKCRRNTAPAPNRDL